MVHTILLIQPGNVNTRTYTDFESINECLEGILKIYEHHLKHLNPDAPVITYDLNQLFDFLNELKDIGCLIYVISAKAYAPFNKAWIKERLHLYLRDVSVVRGEDAPSCSSPVSESDD